MRILLSGIIFLLVCLVGISAQAQNPLLLYDDFNSEFLDIGKWTTSERRDGGVMILESVRELHGGRLHMMGRAFGRTIAIPDNPPIPLGTAAGDVSSSFGLVKVFQSLKFSVKVNDVEVTGCPDWNTSPTNSRARFVTCFFNASKPTPTPGNRIDDVLVQIRIQRSSNSIDKPQLLEVWAEVVRCSDTNCLNVFPDYPLVGKIGNIMLGQWATIQIDWDIHNSEFNLKLNKEPTITVPYTWHVYPVSSPANTLGVANRIANCPADERSMGFIDAEFENLFVRELPSP